MLLALIHSLLVQQRYYGNRAINNTCHWSLFDLAASVELFRKGFVQMDALPGVVEKISRIYEGHCTNPEDAVYVSSLIRRVSQGILEKEEVNIFKFNFYFYT